MSRILRFKSHLHVESTDADKVYLIGAEQRFTLSGRMHALVAPLIDGRRSDDEIIAALADRASAPEVFYSLFTLEEKGYVVAVEPESEPPPEQAAFWYELGLDAAHAARRLAATPVAVEALSGRDPAPLIAALTGAGLNIDGDAALRVVVTGSYLDPELAQRHHVDVGGLAPEHPLAGHLAGQRRVAHASVATRAARAASSKWVAAVSWATRELTRSLNDIGTERGTA